MCPTNPRLDRKSILLEKKRKILRELKNIIGETPKNYSAMEASQHYREVVEELLLENKDLLFPGGELPKVTMVADLPMKRVSISVEGKPIGRYLEDLFTYLIEKGDPNV